MIDCLLAVLVMILLLQKHFQFHHWHRVRLAQATFHHLTGSIHLWHECSLRRWIDDDPYDYFSTPSGTIISTCTMSSASGSVVVYLSLAQAQYVIGFWINFVLVSILYMFRSHIIFFWIRLLPKLLMKKRLNIFIFLHLCSAIIVSILFLCTESDSMILLAPRYDEISFDDWWG